MTGTKRVIIFLFLLLLGFAGLIYTPDSVHSSGSDPQAVVIEIKGTIDRGMYNLVKRSLESSRELGAPVVILELDTPGGFIDTTWEIKRMLDDYPGTVYAYIRSHALSAGSYLALAADAIYMYPTATIGAAEPRYPGGITDEKIISAWEADMRSVALSNERDSLVAAAMVRKEIAIEGLVKEGELLTLTTQDALAVGYCEGTAATVNEMLQLTGMENAEVIRFETSVIEHVIRITTNPYVAILLLALGIIGLFMELFTVGFGIAGIISLSSFALYFSGHMLGGLAGYEIILLFAAGIVLMLIEAFMPGFGVFGIGGLVATLLSIILAAASIGEGLRLLASSSVIAGIVLYFSLRAMNKRGFLRKIILEDSEKKELGYFAPPERGQYEGKEGVVLTQLRPAGTVEIGDKRIDAVSEGAFIPAGARVKVVQVEGGRVIVRPFS